MKLVIYNTTPTHTHTSYTAAHILTTAALYTGKLHSRWSSEAFQAKLFTCTDVAYIDSSEM